MAFVRVSDEPIRTREKIYEPDIVVVLDPTLLDIVNVGAGLKKDGIVVLNTTKSAKEIRKTSGINARLAIVDASRIAMETMGIPITNTTLLGAMLKATDLLPPSALEGPLQERFGRIAGKNIQALQRAYEETVVKE
jgi:pyruvate ferredoxin oxidoreductase gamma subunit